MKKIWAGLYFPYRSIQRIDFVPFSDWGNKQMGPCEPFAKGPAGHAQCSSFTLVAFVPTGSKYKYKTNIKYRRHRHLSCSEDCLPFCGFCPHWLHSLPSLFKLNNQQINSRKKANRIFSGCATMVASYCLAFAILLSLATPSSFSQVLSKLSIFNIWLMQKVMIKTMTKSLATLFLQVLSLKTKLWPLIFSSHLDIKQNFALILPKK